MSENIARPMLNTGNTHENAPMIVSSSLSSSPYFIEKMTNEIRLITEGIRYPKTNNAVNNVMSDALIVIHKIVEFFQ